MFKRNDGLESVREFFGDTPCFITVGLAWIEWIRIRPSDGNFALKTLGSGSSVGLGFAVAMPQRKVAVLDGDGAVSMNVNGLITVGRVQPKNLIHIVFDNKIYESSGCVPTATAHNLDLVGVARAMGIKKAQRVETVEAFKKAVKIAFDTDGPHFIVADTQPAEEASSTAYARLDEIECKFLFIRHLEKLEGRPLREDAIDVKLSIS
jgi:phosphonopyruvate decarboxylase